MTKSFLKYLVGGWFIFGGETFATLEEPGLRGSLETMLSRQSLPMLLLFQRIADCLTPFPGTDEVKGSAMGRFLETNLETSREKLASMIEEEERREEERKEKERRVQALKARFKAEFEEKDREMKRVWGSLNKWGKICGDIDRSADEITEQLFNFPKVSPDFFARLCKRWEVLLENPDPENTIGPERRKEILEQRRRAIINHNGFRYSLAIMLINAKELFGENWEPLKTLYMTAYREGCNFSNPKAMKEKGMEIMKSAKNYNLAYVYLGSEAENEKRD